MPSRDPLTVQAALDFQRSLGAPTQLVRHAELVAMVAQGLSDTLKHLGFDHDTALVCVGAALHDVGKITHPEELHAPGRKHEEAGQQLLLSHGMSQRLARICRTHGAWDTEPVLLPEELLVALADHLWKGTRSEQLELLLVEAVATRVGCDRWEALLKLDPIFENVAAGASERLARARM